ncbi:MAG TPA: histidine ammonia-lyase, partial [Candidatus Baltobacteraceae bacterium]|nr:histidine ammonia-lyase [Candidatus Baltobacteraceae bacterium]
MATLAKPLELDGEVLALETIEAIALHGARVAVSAPARARVAAARACVERQFDAGAIIYGVTTGFGRMANVVIERSDAAQLQRNLVRSHSAGTGEPLREEFVRAAGVLRVSSLAAGHSGIRTETLDMLVELLNRGVTPVVPCQGSVGASGDLAPLAHMTLTLMGEGEAFYRGERMPSAQALARAELHPLELVPKEGLSLINGTEVMTGIAALCQLRAERLLASADVIGALSLEAFLGTDAAFDRRINALRPHPGQALVADRLRAFLSGSEIMLSHRDCGRVQDPYSFRCIPVVHGAARDAAAHARRVLEIEAISVTDNPLIFPDEDEFLTGGNFHGQPVGVVCDLLKAVMVEVASMSERRAYLLLNAEERGLPLFLSHKPGLESGLMIAQYTAAALVSESKPLASPSSVDSIPTSAGQEDHVSMGTIAARTLDRVLDNVEGVLACELLCALAATDFRRPLRSGGGTGAAFAAARERIEPLESDRVQAPDIQRARELIGSGILSEAAGRSL